ncbi:MAG: hypothetical protein M1331_02810 [Candidatus Marsarchaeota archaeon]|nr:hypothetical protein [Candidatus Marsarchaeota archaeon]
MAHKVFILNIRKYLVTQPRTKRRNKAVKFVRERIAHYTKLPLEAVKIDQTLNSMITKFSARTMNKLKLDVNIENGKAVLTHFIEERRLKPSITRKYKTYETMVQAAKQKKEGRIQSGEEAQKPVAPISVNQASAKKQASPKAKPKQPAPKAGKKQE